MHCSFFFSILMFCFSYLEWDPLKSCVSMCFGILFMSCYISLGLHVWYSYFIVLIFLSGIFSLLTYFCSMSNFSYYENYFYFFMVFSLMCIFFLFFFNFDYLFSCYLDMNFLSVYYDFNYYYIFWIISLMLLFLNLISFNLGESCYMRGL